MTEAEKMRDAASWLPCPLCGERLHYEGDGMEHPASDTCPLDSMWMPPEHSVAWNRRIPDMAAAIAERDAEIERLTARLKEEMQLYAEQYSRAEAAEAMFAAVTGMVSIVEGIDGAMNHGAWRDERGMRIKDTPEWVSLYNAHAAMKEGR